MANSGQQDSHFYNVTNRTFGNELLAKTGMTSPNLKGSQTPLTLEFKNKTKYFFNIYFWLNYILKGCQNPFYLSAVNLHLSGSLLNIYQTSSKYFCLCNT